MYRSQGHKPAEVTIVGSGILGLLCGFQLHKAGYQVTFVDAGPDPLQISYDLQKSGATFSGGDARHASVTETTPWASPSMAGILDIRTKDGGWLAKQLDEFDAAEREWINEFYSLTSNPQKYKAYFADVIKINEYGKSLWRKLFNTNPGIFSDIGYSEPLSIFFLDSSSMTSETKIEVEVNSTPTVKLSPSDIARAFPSLEAACSSKLIVGGLIVDGFAVNAITLAQRIIRALKAEGANFYWNEKITQIIFNKENLVSHMISRKGRLIEAENYVLCIGTGNTELINQSLAYKKILGVAGVWVSIPNPGIKSPFKINAPWPTGYINATVFRNRILLSGGYGFIGSEQLTMESPGIQGLFTHLESVIKQIFPANYARAKMTKSLDRRSCVRPSTATGLGIFEVLRTSRNGNFIIVGGNCAGGFTQSPVIGEAVVATLKKEEHMIHTLL